LGRWYEIARLNHRFERGLEQVTATYSLQKDGGIRVENAGVNTKTKKRKEAVGKAKFVADKHIGHLKVSFFGPFYGSYVVFHLEPDYSVAMVCGNSREYCWILARKPFLAPEELSKYQKIAQKNGFAVDRFIYPAHSTTAS
ncbi:MAG: lipocalin family protein, partial [Bacteroidota bacterium]